VIREKAAGMIAAIEAEPKSLPWKIRARTGTRKPWYREVSDWD